MDSVRTALIAFLVWMFFRHRDQYPHWRNGLALVTAGCLVIRFVRVAPPLRLAAGSAMAMLRLRLPKRLCARRSASATWSRLAMLPSATRSLVKGSMA